MDFTSILKVKATTAEQLLFNALRSQGIAFTFQHRINKHKKTFYADFYVKRTLSGKCFIIEVDGPYHNKPSQKRKDKRRTRILRYGRNNLHVVRYTNNEVCQELPRVMSEIKNMVENPYCFQDTYTIPHVHVPKTVLRKTQNI